MRNSNQVRFLLLMCKNYVVSTYSNTFVTGNDHLKSLRKMTEFRDHQDIAAFIGPDENCRQEALIASAWNLPMIAFVSYYLCIRILQFSNKKKKSILISEMLRFFTLK